MCSFSFLSVYLNRVCVILILILVLTAVCEAQDYVDSTPVPDYDSDYNATFYYSFYSNASNDELDEFLKSSDGFIDVDEKKETTVTMATASTTTEWDRVNINNAASLPVCPDFRTLLCTLMILMSLNAPRLQHTL